MGRKLGLSHLSHQRHDYVFGYSIAQDISNRGARRLREVSMFPGTTGSTARVSIVRRPFGPVIVPKEFLPKGPSDLRTGRPGSTAR